MTKTSSLRIGLAALAVAILLGASAAQARAEPAASAASAASAAAPAAPAAARPDFLVPDPGFTELGALPDPLGQRELARAALLASGIAAERLAAYESRLDALFAELAASAGGIADPAARGEAILGFLHKRVLKAYVENATTLDGVLDRGTFNCVSSAVLYLLAARSLGLEVEGVRTSDHAFCSLRAGSRRIDVETTNPYGFDPGNKKEFKDSFGRATGYAYVAPGGYGDRAAIGARELVGLILSNRASMLERERRFAEAARVGADYDELCRNGETRRFLDQRINNLVADLASRRDYARAAAMARSAAAAYPGERALSALAATAAYNEAASLAAARDWAGAFDLAVSLRDEYGASSDGAAAPDGTAAPRASEWEELASNALMGLAQSLAAKGEYGEARRAVAERAGKAGPAAAAQAAAVVGEAELVKAANGLPFAEAEGRVDRIYAAGEVALERYSQAMAAIYGNEAGRIGVAGDWLGGAGLAERGRAKLSAAGARGDYGLGRIAANMRRNFAVEAHNRFARLYNAGDYAGAEAEIVKALAALPGDPELERDLAAARKAARAKGAP
jgi:hypothetical protein